MLPYIIALTGIATVVGGFVKIVILPMMFRIVVGTNENHVVQGPKKTITYGPGLADGNVYYRWPAWVPRLGVRVSVIPLSVFQLDLPNYAAYDKGRIPFSIDIVSFWRVIDPAKAASRITSLTDVKSQLTGILQGAMRSILASKELHEILEGRSEFGEIFTKAVDSQVAEWGLGSVKNVELMDIQDAKDSRAISNIMAMKKSEIEMTSRQTVAANMQQAEIAEVNAHRQVDIQKQEAAQQVGVRTAEAEQAVAIRKQQAAQLVMEEQQKTKLKEMAVLETEKVRAAEIVRAAQVVAADQARQTTVIDAEAKRSRIQIDAEAAQKQTVINAEAARQQTVINAEAAKAKAITEAEGQKAQRILSAEADQQNNVLTADGERQRLAALAEGNFVQMQREAEGTRLKGLAQGEADTAVAMAPVNAQIALAKEIGANKEYQTYLVTVEQIKANQAIGVEQAKGLEHADVKIIATAGQPSAGLTSVRELFTPEGATKLAAGLEAFKNSDVGKAVMERVGLNGGARP